MKRIVLKFITTLGLMFFFTLVIPFLNPYSAVSAYAGEVTTQPLPASGSEQSADGTTATGTALVSVTPVPTEDPRIEIKLNVKTKALVKGTSYALKVYNVADGQSITFQSDDPLIASVDEEGVVTANAVGTTFVTVTVMEQSEVISELRCDITVGPPAVSIKLTRSEITLTIGKRTTLKTILQPNNTVEEVKFCSYDPAIAAVSPGGRIVAREVGVTYIFAGIDNGMYDLCKVIVVESEDAESATDGTKSVPDGTQNVPSGT